MDIQPKIDFAHDNKSLWYALMSFSAVYTTFLILGGIWLSNQWELNISSQKQLIDLSRHVDESSVDKDLLASIVVEQNRRLSEFNNKLDNINKKTETIHALLNK